MRNRQVTVADLPECSECIASPPAPIVMEFLSSVMTMVMPPSALATPGPPRLKAPLRTATRRPAAKEHDSRPEAARPGRTSCNPNGGRPRSWRGRTRRPTVGPVACQGAQLSDGRGSFLSQRTGSPKRYYQIWVPVVICRCICRNFAGITFGHLDAGPGRSRAPAFFFAGALSFG